MPKKDYIGECNNLGVPLEDFRLSFCERCLQRECSRSTVSQGSRLEERVATWRERLFTEVPAMNKEDPRYEEISSKRFIPVSVDPAPEVGQGWMDPRDMPDPEPVVEPPTTPVELVEVPAPVEIIEPPPPKTAPAPLFKESGNSVPLQALQTDGGVGRMVEGAPPPQKKTDPWEPVGVSSGGTEKIVAPGARIKLGSGQ